MTEPGTENDLDETGELSYDAAKSELDQIVTRLEGDDVDIDELKALVERARFLVATCKKKIRSVEDEITVLLADVED